jgi:8-oxo-dGTP pyrophosphatase MutT (NUDIX family)
MELRQDLLPAPGGKNVEYTFLHHPGSVVIVVFDATTDSFLCVRQFRHLLGRMSIEFPMGGKHEAEDSRAAALRELAEEACYSASDLRLLGIIHPSNGVSDEESAVFEAIEAIRLESHATTAPGEIEQVLWVPNAELRQSIAHGLITDSSTISAYFLFSLHHNSASV